MRNSNRAYSLLIIAAAIAVSGVSSASAAWNPGGTPTSGNVPAPVIAGYEGQIIQGYVTLKGLANAALNTFGPYGLIVENGLVGIGTISPTSKLEVAGTINSSGLAISGGSPAAGRVLTALDATGKLGWSPSADAGLSLYFGPVVESINKVLIQGGETADRNCPNGLHAVGFKLYNVGGNFSSTGSLLCRTIKLVPAGTIPPSNGIVVPPTSEPSATVTLTAPSTVTLYEDTGYANITVSWTTTSTKQCVASGAWSGNKASSGSQSVQITTSGSKVFTLTCGSAWDTRTVRVNFVPASNL